MVLLQAQPLGINLPETKMRCYEVFGWCGRFPASCPQAAKLCWLVEINCADTIYLVSNESQECLEGQS